MASMSSFRDYACGWGAALINVVVTFPMNKTIFRQQVTGDNLPFTIRQLYSEGLLHLYRGFLPPLLQKTTTLGVMFGSYNNYRHVFDRHLSFNVSVCVSSMLAGATEAMLTPLERVQTLLQGPQTHREFKNTFNAFRKIYNECGVREFYRGFTPILIRNSCSNAVFFSLRIPLKSRLPKATNQLQDSLYDFISGACLGAIISTIFYPVNVLKSNMQLQYGGPFQRTWTTFQIVFRQRGSSVRMLFRGVHLNYTRSLISWGIINCSFELLRGLYDRTVGV